MRHKLTIAALAALVSTSVVVPAPATAYQSSYYRDHHVYHGNGGRYDRRYRHRCGGGNGAVGTVAGGVGGALIGNAVGGGTLGTVAGGVGGALLGRHLDKQNTRSRRGC